jgi:outer membrane protein TolC
MISSVFICLLTGITIQVQAQEKLTLDKAISMALDNHPSLKSSSLAISVADEQLKVDKSGRIPQVSSGLSLQRNLIIPSTPVPLGLITGQGDTGELTFLQFGTDWQSNIGVSLNYDLFNPASRQQIISGEENTKLAKIDYEADEASVRLEVTKVYAELVLVTAQMEYAAEDTAYNHQVFADAMEKYASGRLNDQDMNNARSMLNRSRSRFNQSKSLYDQSRIELTYRLGMGSDTAALPVVSEDLETLLSILGEKEIKTIAAENTNGYNRLQTQVLHDSLLLKNTKLMMLPTVSLKANLASNYFRNNLQLFNSDHWYGNSFVGLSLNIPITEDITTQRKISTAEIQLEQMNAEMQDFRNRRNADLMKTQRALEHDSYELETKKREVALADENFATAREQHAVGKLLDAELYDAELTMENARVNYFQAAYNYIITRIQLENLVEVR